MKKFTRLFCFPVLMLFGIMTSCLRTKETSSTVEKKAKEAGTVFYQNPVIDRNFPDPTVIRAADGFYYVYGTNSTVDGKVVNMQVMRSRDLVSWEDAGDALPQKPSWADSDFWAPHVLYDEETKTYFLYYSGESTNEELGKCLGVATSRSPAGPFIDKGEPLLCGEGFVNIDPMAYDDPLTKKKLLYWGSGFDAIKVRELAEDRLSFKEGSEAVELVWPKAGESSENYERLVEGAWVIYRNGYYYMFYSGDNCCGEGAHYAAMVARSKKATGPFVTLEEAEGKTGSLVLERSTRWIAPGHNSIIRDEAGQDWIFYHAIDSTARENGRLMLMDKISYSGGWPKIKDDQPTSEKVKAPVVSGAEE